jgi:hypothetical protein
MFNFRDSIVMHMSDCRGGGGGVVLVTRAIEFFCV